MGAQESRTEHNDSDAAAQDYYSILGVTESADQDEIKASNASTHSRMAVISVTR
jgi:hypothetical protein